VALLSASAVLLIVFLIVEVRVTSPLMPLRIFRLRTVAAANAVGLLLGGSFFAFIFIGTLYMQQVLDYSPLQSGVAWLATSLTSVALAGVSQMLVTRISPGKVMGFGMTLIAGGILWATQVPVHGSYWSALAGPFLITGIGGAFSFIPISIAGLTGVAEGEAGLASGLLNTSQQIGGAIGVAIASTVAATHEKTLLGNGHAANVALTGSFHWAFWVCGVIALLALPSTALILRRTRAADVDAAVPVLEEAVEELAA
jgi:MFS family permease